MPTNTKEGWREQYENHHAHCIATGTQYTNKEIIGILDKLMESDHRWNRTFIEQVVIPEVEERVRRECAKETRDMASLWRTFNYWTPLDKKQLVIDALESLASYLESKQK